jgi:hypothetical protein
MKRSLVGAFAAVAVAIVACGGSTTPALSGGSDASADGGSSSVSAQQACTDVASALCTAVNGCSAFLVQLEYGDVATCQTRFQATCITALAAPGTGMTASTMEACATAVAGEACADIVSNNPPSACHAVAGQLANGTACGDPSQCQSTYCNRGTDGTCGACGTRSTSGACNRDEDCPYGQTCLLPTGMTTGGTCISPGASASNCDAMHPCNKTLACKNGTCSAPDEAGAACIPGDTSNFFGSCDALKGLACHPLRKVCMAIGVASAGQPCGAVNGGFFACAAAGTCNTAGTCTAAAADGASCGAMSRCLPPAQCSGGVCKLSDPAMCH